MKFARAGDVKGKGRIVGETGRKSRRLESFFASQAPDSSPDPVVESPEPDPVVESPEEAPERESVISQSEPESQNQRESQ